MPQFKTIDDLEVAGRRVLVRADLNVPVRDGKVTDATRLERLAPTVEALAARGARVVLLSHFGRPKGAPDPAMSLRPVVPALAQALGGREVAFAEDCVGPDAEKAAAALPEGSVLVLENLRFHPGEEADDPDFAAALARCGELYVNDAFSAAHRAHASTHALARLLPAAAGRNMQAELEALHAALDDPKRPVAAVVGGAKVSSKIDVLTHLATRMDAIIIGGGMANTFLHARGVAVGASLHEADLSDTARDVERRAEDAGCRLLLPSDVVIAAKLEPGVEAATVAVDAVPSDRMILDLGPETVAMLERELAGWHTLLWNGPLGAFETPPFDAATTRFARAAAERTDEGGLLTVAGGGDTVAALAQAGVVDRFSYVSTAGGAFLEWLEGKTLPGVRALEEAASR